MGGGATHADVLSNNFEMRHTKGSTLNAAFLVGFRMRSAREDPYRSVESRLASLFGQRVGAAAKCVCVALHGLIAITNGDVERTLILAHSTRRAAPPTVGVKNSAIVIEGFVKFTRTTVSRQKEDKTVQKVAVACRLTITAIFGAWKTRQTSKNFFQVLYSQW